MFTRRSCRAIDNDGNVVTLTETQRSVSVDTYDGPVEFLGLPQMHDGDGELLTYESDGKYRGRDGRKYRIEELYPSG